MNALILSCQPDSDDLAMREMRNAAPDSTIVREIAPGVLLISTERGFESLSGRWRAAPPIFIRHIFPVQKVIQISGDDPVPIMLAALPDLLPRFAPDSPFSVQTRLYAEHFPAKPFDINSALSGQVAAGGLTLDVRSPEQALSVVVGGGPGGFTAYVGVSAVADNLSDWAGGVRRFARDEAQISRSEFKLLEALETFQINLPVRGHALDLGAAPGGWTRILRTFGQLVTAVDPALLDPRVMEDRGVRYKRMTAEAYLQDDPDTFDLIVNDMRMDARDSARLMGSYVRQLRPGGVALMTVKLPENNRAALLDHTFELLNGAYEVAGARQLFHNRSEITVYLREKKA